MTPRQRTILFATIRAYIRTGEPIGSAAVAPRLRLRVSPATVRNEFSTLEDAGFLSHPHPSAGRVPTAAGYREYVDDAVSHTPHPRAAVRLQQLERSSRGDFDEVLARTLARWLADWCGTLALTTHPRTASHEAGLGHLSESPEALERTTLREIQSVLNALEEESERVLALATAGPVVFIDGENPLVRTHRVSMILTAPRRAGGEQFLAALVGPLRMPYDRNVRVLAAVHRVFTAV